MRSWPPVRLHGRPWVTRSGAAQETPSGKSTDLVGNPLGVTAPSPVIARLLALASRQYGLLTRRQWLDSGLTQRQLEHAVRTGALRSVHRGVYVIAGSGSSFERDVLAACLATGGVASHRCAAYLWKFRKFGTAGSRGPGHHRPLPESLGRNRASNRLHRSERTHLGVLPVTSRGRTLLDLVSITPQLVEGALDGLLHRRQLALRTMKTMLDRAGRNHPAHGVLAPLVAARGAGRRPTESELEATSWR